MGTENSLQVLLQRYVHLTDIQITLGLHDGSRIQLHNAAITADGIINHSIEIPGRQAIPYSVIAFAELEAL